MFCCSEVCTIGGAGEATWNVFDDRPDGTNVTAAEIAGLATFMVHQVKDLEAAWQKHTHKTLRTQLSSVVLLCNGTKPEELEPWISKLRCKVFVVDCLGIIGWSIDQQRTVECDEKGRGCEMGFPGPPEAKPGVTVVAVRKQSGHGKVFPVVSSSVEATPTMLDGAVVHVVQSALSQQAEISKLLLSEKHAVSMGGFSKSCQEYVSGQWETRPFVAITFFKSEHQMVNVGHSYCLYDPQGGQPLMECEGKDIVKSVPPGYRVAYVVSYQCFSRGHNAYSKFNVEADVTSALCGKEIPSFGMFCYGEFGNIPESNPLGWNEQISGKEGTVRHTFVSTVAVVAVRDKSAAAGSRSVWQDAMRGKGLFQTIRDIEPSSGIDKGQHQLSNDIEDTHATRDGEKSNYKDYLRCVKFADVAVPAAASFNFWKCPGGLDPRECYKMSQPCQAVDIFLSHAMKPDPEAPILLMRTPLKYAIHKAVEIYIASWSVVCKEQAAGSISEDKFMDRLGGLTYWCDVGCVDHSDVGLKMHILKRHLEDFVANAKYVILIISTQYFRRAWCLYELCIAVKTRDNLDDLIVSGVMGQWFEEDRQALADAIVNASFETSTCFDPADRVLIKQKIDFEYRSVAHFDRLVKFAACALNARANMVWNVETCPTNFTIWVNIASRCGFADLAEVLGSVDCAALHAQSWKALPDQAGQTFAKERIALLQKGFIRDWFQSKVLPLLNQELERAIRAP